MSIRSAGSRNDSQRSPRSRAASSARWVRSSPVKPEIDAARSGKDAM
ncbi:hypothetical protein P9139_13040 [Curtobacterium flaccumfaciens]|nr:hypothetical protein P9139_13040 [Curtobacterium flaccumfaciens]